MASPPDLPEVRLDATSLYLEEIFTDRRAGSLRRLTPVKTDGSPDPSRPVLFSGQTQLLTPAGVLPLGFDIEASTLEAALPPRRALAATRPEEALQMLPEGGQAALEQVTEEARELRREAASRIVVPEAGGGMGPGPGGGKIKFP